MHVEVKHSVIVFRGIFLVRWVEPFWCEVVQNTKGVLLRFTARQLYDLDRHRQSAFVIVLRRLTSFTTRLPLLAGLVTEVHLPTVSTIHICLVNEKSPQNAGKMSRAYGVPPRPAKSHVNTFTGRWKQRQQVATGRRGLGSANIHPCVKIQGSRIDTRAGEGGSDGRNSGQVDEITRYGKESHQCQGARCNHS